MRPSSPSKLLAAAGVPALLVSDLVNIRYLAGLPLSSGLVLVLPRRMILFTDGRYTEVANKDAVEGVEVRDLDVIESAMKKVAQCGFEPQAVTVSRFLNWKRKFKNTKFVRKTGVIEEFRRSKDDDELRHFKRAQRITREMLRRVPTALRKGVTERGVAWRLREWAYELGADELSFDPIVAFASHSSRPHHHPTDRKLKKGDMVQIDVGAKYKGYCADQSDVFFTGKMSALENKVYAAVTEAKEKAIQACVAGVTNCALDSLARSVLKTHKLNKYFVHSLGHGVGLDIHEGVILSENAKPVKLLKNEIVTIEPGVYIPGKFGIRLEEEIIVK